MAESAENIRDGVNREVVQLQAEVQRLKERLTAKGEQAAGQVRDQAAVALKTASGKAKDAADYVRSEAASAADSAREHPAALTSVVAAVGALAFIAGYLIGNTSAPAPRSRWL